MTRQRQPVEWSKVDGLMLKSFTGGGLTESEQATVQAAFLAEPAEYGKRHTRIVRDEVARKQRDGV